MLPSVAAIVVFLLFCALLAGLGRLRHHPRATPERLRKAVHVAAGTTAFGFPVLFDEALPVWILVGSIAALLLARRRHVVTSEVARAGFGEIWMPLSIGVLFAVTRGQPAAAYALPLAFLVYADTAAALVGTRFGRHPYGSKTVEGTLAFFGVSLGAGLLVLPAGFAVILALAATALEHVSWQGLDNLAVPLGSYAVLHFGFPEWTLTL